jgi:hypothetical protein
MFQLNYLQCGVESSCEDDPQKFLVYNAEEEAHAKASRYLKQFFWKIEVSNFARSVVYSRWWRKHLGPNYIAGLRVYKVSNRSDRAVCYVNSNSQVTLEMPKWAWNKRAILHELAHVIQPRPSQTHGPEFAASHLILLRQFVNTKVYNIFYSCYDEYEIKVGFPNGLPFWAIHGVV